jgi:SM-20-related protein
MIPCETLQNLADKQWCQLEGFFAPSLVQSLYQEAQNRWNQGQFQAAKVGRSQEQTRAAEIRSDSTAWIDLQDPFFKEFSEQIRILKSELNQALFLGLQDFECHFTRYSEGQFYDEHIDQPRIKSPLHGQRVISFVLYLNPEWKPEFGGQLVIRLNSQEIQIFPESGRAVLFRSDTVPHAVLPAYQDRWSLTGWFRRT